VGTTSVHTHAREYWEGTGRIDADPPLAFWDRNRNLLHVLVEDTPDDSMRVAKASRSHRRCATPLGPSSASGRPTGKRQEEDSEGLGVDPVEGDARRGRTTWSPPACCSAAAETTL
jgi:hypothetical protein